jgi:hypothetical protein
VVFAWNDTEIWEGKCMLIQETSISVRYPKIDGIKKAYYNHEELLKEFFNEAMVLPIPDNAPVEVPRINIKTLHEHAELNISPISAAFVVRYNDGYERDWSACVKYIIARMSRVFEFLNIMTNNNYEYIGVVTNVIYDEIADHGAQQISNTLLNSSKISDIYDVNIRYTFVEKDNMFINIMLQNARLFKQNISMEEAGALCAENQIAESIGAIIDINDRYGFNNKPDYKSDSDMLNTLLESMSDVINNMLSVLIERGEY